MSDFHDRRTAVREPVEKGLRSGEIRGLEGLLEEGGGVKRQPDGPTNRHKNDPLVRVGYLRQETA